MPRKADRRAAPPRPPVVPATAGWLSSADIDGLSRGLRRALAATPTPSFVEMSHFTAPGMLAARLTAARRHASGRPASAPLPHGGHSPAGPAPQRRPSTAGSAAATHPPPDNGAVHDGDAFASTIKRLRRRTLSPPGVGAADGGGSPLAGPAARESAARRRASALSPSDQAAGTTVGVAPTVCAGPRRRGSAAAAGLGPAAASAGPAAAAATAAGDDDGYDAFFNAAAPQRSIDQYLRRRKSAVFGKYAAAAAELQRRASTLPQSYLPTSPGGKGPSGGTGPLGLHVDTSPDRLLRRYLGAGGRAAASLRL